MKFIIKNPTKSYLITNKQENLIDLWNIKLPFFALKADILLYIESLDNFLLRGLVIDQNSKKVRSLYILFKDKQYIIDYLNLYEIIPNNDIMIKIDPDDDITLELQIMETKFTKGNWELHERNITCNSKLIITCWYTKKIDDEPLEGESWLDCRERTKEDRRIHYEVEPQANAKLVAAAPDMYEALEHIIEYWNRDRNDEAMHDALWHIIETAEKAIKKATE